MSERVLIIGAGVGGLALAHGLKRAGIAFRLFERDAAATARAQGYRFRINPQGAEALHSVLTAEQWAGFEQTCAGLPAGMVRLNGITGEAPTDDTHRPPMPPAASDFKSYNADRTAFRRYLLESIGGENVSFGKKCTAVDYSTAAGSVTATFEDGSTETGTLLVGADGVNSFVRRHCFPSDLEPIDTDARLVYGKTPITDKVKDQVLPAILGNFGLIQDRRGAYVKTLFFDTMKFPDNGIEHPQDYIYWVQGANKAMFGRPDDRLLGLSHEESRDVSLEQVADWHPQIRAVLELQDVGQTALLKVMTTVPKRLSWESQGRITVLGDAIHVMPPAGGMGANTALLDAALLSKILTAKFESKEPFDGSDVQEYERKMQQHAKEAVLGSARGGKWMFDQKSFDEE